MAYSSTGGGYASRRLEGRERESERKRESERERREEKRKRRRQHVVDL